MKTILWLFVFTMLIPLLLVFVFGYFSGAPTAKAIKLSAVLCGPVFLVLAFLTTRNTVSRQDGYLSIKGFGMYSIRVSDDSVLSAAEQAARLAAVSEKNRFSFKVSGISLPGYHVGWFRTKGGRNVFAFITDSSRSVSVFHSATDDGKDLIINSEYLSVK
jgi:hypothetical protein